MNSKGNIKYFSLRNLTAVMLMLFSGFSVLYSQQPEIEVTVFSDLTDTDGNNIVSATDLTLFTIRVKNTGNISNILFSVRKPDFFEIIIDIEVRDSNHLQNIIAALRMEKEVSSLERLKG